MDAHEHCRPPGKPNSPPTQCPPRVVPAFCQADFRKAKEKVLYKKKEGVPEGLYM
jgi:hypothetical protein